MQHAVRLGDVEQPVDNVFQHLAIFFSRAAKLGHLGGIGFKAGDVLLRQVVKPRHVACLPVGDLEKLLEGGDFVRRDDAISFGHLGGQRDHRH